MDETPIFRAVKRRKQAHKQDPTENKAVPDDDEVPSQIVKSRPQPRARLKGVQFTNHRSNISESNSSDLIVASATQQTSEPIPQYSINSRFIGSTTGQVVNVDKHMTAYVDQQMAKKHSSLPKTTYTSGFPTTRHSHPRSQPHNGDGTQTDHSNDDDNSSRSTSSASPPPRDRQPPPPSTTASSFHPLAEIDLAILPPSTTGPTDTTNPPPSCRKGPRRPRLGRDGKPFRARPRKRRGSDDIARDGLVEQVLHESAVQAVGSTNAGVAEAKSRQGNNEALDEKMAMEFQRQFLDAVADRQQQQQQRSNKSGTGANAAKSTGTSGGGAAAMPQGPRLGGSRSARAKLVAAMQAAADSKTEQGK